jgi:hypothetical protein
MRKDKRNRQVKGSARHPMSRTGEGAAGPLVMANVIAALPPVGYFSFDTKECPLEIAFRLQLGF